MNRTVLWIVAALLFAGAGGGYYIWRQSNRAGPPPPPVAEEPAQPSTPVKKEPEIQHPIEQAQVPASTEVKEKPLPELGQSDAAALSALSAGLGSVPGFVIPKDLIRRIAATVDNLSRNKVAQQVLPVQPVSGRFVTSGQQEDTAISTTNAARYAGYVRAVEAIDADKLVAQYVRLYPLFQQAYKELGYPSGYFNDRLVNTIDHLLAAPSVPPPVKLVSPKVLYEFADPELEQRSAGQKLMIRIGPDNAERVKAKLREIRRAVTKKPPQ